MQIPQLTFTRFFASMAIVVLHYGLYTFPFEIDFIAILVHKGIGAISFFFTLSGFILVIATSQNGVLPSKISFIKFYKKRAIRILPVYLLSILLFFFLNFQFDPKTALIWQLQSYVYSIFLMQSWNYELALDINYPAWSLSVEAFFYLIFPFIFWFFQKYKSHILIILLIIASVYTIVPYAVMINTDVPENFVKFFPPFHLGTFVIGVISGILFIRHKEWFHGKGKKIILSSTIGLTIIFASLAYCKFIFFQYQHNGMFAPYFILILISLAISKGKFIDFLSSKPLIFMGAISYSIYIFQFPILQFCQKYVPGLIDNSESDIFYPYVVILVSFSCMTYLFIEKPISSFFKRRS